MLPKIPLVTSQAFLLQVTISNALRTRITKIKVKVIIIIY